MSRMKCWECAGEIEKSRLKRCPNCETFWICKKCAEYHANNCQGRCWRIRIKRGAEDLTSQAWGRNEVGVWYGAFTAQDLLDCANKPPNDFLAYLNNLPHQRALEWKVTKSHLKTVQRLSEIRATDWVMVYLPSTETIGVARLSSTLTSATNHPLNRDGDTFKFRTVSDKRTFELYDLPDVYRILQSQGRANVYVLRGVWDIVQPLLKCRTAIQLKKTLKALPFDELLGFLGPSGWESFCFAYLIYEEEFVPTGLSIGRTLPAVDIVGRKRSDGTRIIAQCKKSNRKEEITEKFRVACKAHDIAYYFAYGGCIGEVPANVAVIDRDGAIKWADSPNGSRFRDLLLTD